MKTPIIAALSCVLLLASCGGPDTPATSPKDPTTSPGAPTPTPTPETGVGIQTLTGQSTVSGLQFAAGAYLGTSGGAGGILNSDVKIDGNGNYSIVLPELPSNMMVSISPLLGVTCGGEPVVPSSDSAALGNFGAFYASGKILTANLTANSLDRLVYVDRSLTISGSGICASEKTTVTINLKLAKGWNLIRLTQTTLPHSFISEWTNSPLGGKATAVADLKLSPLDSRF